MLRDSNLQTSSVDSSSSRRTSGQDVRATDATKIHRCRTSEKDDSRRLSAKCRSEILLSHPADTSSDSGVTCCDKEPALPTPEDKENRRKSKAKPARQPTTLKPNMWRSLSAFSVRHSSNMKRRDSSTAPPPGERKCSTGDSVDDEVDSGISFESSKKRIGGSVPGNGLSKSMTASSNLGDATAEELAESLIRKRGRSTSFSGKLSRLSRSFRWKKSTEKVNAEPTAVPSGESTIIAETAVVYYGTVRRRMYSHRLSIGFSLNADEMRSGSSTSSPPCSPDVIDGTSRKLRDGSESPPKKRDPSSIIRLVKILKMKKYMTNRYIAGMAVTEKGDLVLVDLREAYLVDDAGNLIRKIGPRNSSAPLFEPFSVAVGAEGRLVFTDHNDQTLKIYSSKGSHLKTVSDFAKVNIAGVAVAASSRKHTRASIGDIYVAGTDKKHIFVHAGGETTPFPPRAPGAGFVLQHPYCVAINPITREVIVGDDQMQSVVAMTMTGEVVWTFRPERRPDERTFFPSSISVDAQAGLIFVSDLYNCKIFLLNSAGNLLKTLLSLQTGLSDHPTATAVDGRGNLFVADEERTVKVFQYCRSLDLNSVEDLDNIF